MNVFLIILHNFPFLIDVCNLPADIGPCRGYFIKWYYNAERGQCEEFGFGGCQGNGNRFSTQEECEHICLHKDEPQPSGNDTTASHQGIVLYLIFT